MESSYTKIVIKGTEIAYQDIGAGTPLICFPGWTLSSNSYLPLSEHLDLNTVRMILPDIPGWAGKSSSLSGRTTVTKLSSLFSEFIQSFNFSTFNILGYSYGGALVQHILKDYSFPLENVFLVSTLSEGGDKLTDQFQKPIQMYEHAKKLNLPELLIKERIAQVFKHSIDKKNYPQEVLENKYAEAIIGEYFSGDIKAMIESGFSLLKYNYLSESLRSYDVHVIYADEDMEFIKSSSEKIAEFVNVQPIVVKGDHNHLLFYPERVAREINNIVGI